MRKSLRGKKPKKIRKISLLKIKLLLITLIICVLCALIYVRLDQQIMPMVMTMAHIKANAIATEAISRAINNAFKEKNITAQDLVIYDYDESGNIVSWTINTPMINELCADIVVGISKELESIPTTTLTVPLGSLSDSRIFANIGPKLNIKVLPTGAATINYDKEFRSTGINQINHTVWLNVDTMVQVVVPLASDQIRVTRKVILVDKVLSGKVPPSYVDTTRDSILDADLQDPFEEPKSFEYPSVE
ncbi:sporulation protein YunB [Defluviitalea saccharophila]|uniref:Sporulation protein YunB n=1 Tax=Defluviitalea saccharophila TaxID=879970 RepID=A0ABZ2Y718_9FIRM|nr:sporulation protein YunB [Candidatus Epulonipiscium sp.]